MSNRKVITSDAIAAVRLGRRGLSGDSLNRGYRDAGMIRSPFCQSLRSKVDGPLC
jgi:hypothetical protein